MHLVILDLGQQCFIIEQYELVSVVPSSGLVVGLSEILNLLNMC